MKEITIKITEQGSNDALAALSKADKERALCQLAQGAISCVPSPCEEPDA
jgi:hypothetical protein